MRIKIIGVGGKDIFPINYRTMIMSMIKKSVKLGDEDYYKELYFYNDKKNKKIKPFTFGVYFNNFKIDGNEINVKGDIAITISTADYNFGVALYNGLLKLNEYTFKNKYVFVKKRMLLEKEKVIDKNIVTMKTLSPIYIKDKDNKPVSVEDKRFSEELNYISNILLKSYRGYGLKKELNFIPINMKKMVIKEQFEDFIAKSKKDYMYINAYSGIFTLEGDKEDLNLLLQLGLGFRRSEGFSLVDLI